jgi:hypothetical protein
VNPIKKIHLLKQTNKQMILFLLKAQDTIANLANKQKIIPTSVQDKSISVSIQILLYTVLLLAGVGFVLYLLNLGLKHIGFFKNLKKYMNKNYFFILILFPIFYLIYYYAYYLPYANPTNPSIWLKGETADFLRTASLTFLSAGTVTGTLKWLNNLAFFKNQFTEIIRSPDFADVLSEKMKDLALSDSYLLQRNDLEEIWKRVTICKYQQKFPELAAEIESKIENDLYLERSLSYYYKNFRIQLNFTLEGDVIKIVEISSFTVIANSDEKIEIAFGTTSFTKDSELLYSKFIQEGCTKDGLPLTLQSVNEDELGLESDYCIRFKAELSGKKKYIIERQVELTQDINVDRVFTFSSSRIIEDIAINLKHDSNLKLFFSPSGKNIFNPDNHIRGEKSDSYISRDLLLPGEKFKVFIYKKG